MSGKLKFGLNLRSLDRRGKLSADLLLGIANTALVVLALGALVYTRVLYHRPKITEEGERQRLAGQKQTRLKSNSGLVQFDPFVVNIKSIPSVPLPAEGSATQIQGKTHFVRVAMTLEIRDVDHKYKIDDYRPKIMDQLLTLLGGKQFNEITNVQGRYVLRNEILDMVNTIIQEPLVTNVYFTEFITQ